MGALRDLLASLIVRALNSFDNMMANAVNVLGGGLSAWSEIVNFATMVIRPFALMIIGICLLIEIGQVAAKVDLVKWEHGLKLCVKMVLSVVAIDIAPVFLEAMYAQAAAWIISAGALGGGSAFGGDIATIVEPLVTGVSGIWATLGLFMTTVILLIAVQLCGLIIAVIAFARMFELYVYLAVAPLPMAFFPLGDGTGGGFSRITAKFLRAFAAICLQGVLMLICIRVFGVIMVDVMNDAIIASAGLEASVQVNELMYTMLLGSIVLVMSVVKSGSWVKSILDAN
ncbi:MAG: hypothetical protein FWE05_04920 [Defluviitaleaceae bacterium]|nr:hypothetical protein [Defluviitaleaceae bacterium]